MKYSLLYDKIHYAIVEVIHVFWMSEVSKPRAKRLYDVMSSFLPETVHAA